MKMPFFYAKDQGEEEKLSASHNIKNGQNYGSTFLHSCLNEKDVENEMGSCIYIYIANNVTRQTGQFQLVKNWWKMPQLKNLNISWVIITTLKI